MNGLGAPSLQKPKRFVAPPVLPRCYLCGQQFGTTSIGIHVPQCYAKKLAQWEAGDLSTRGQPPKHPDTVNWKGSGLSKGQQNEEQFKEFVSNLEPCPNCGRRFLADRLVVHLRSCKPGSSSKPVTTRASSPGFGRDSSSGGSPHPPQGKGKNLPAVHKALPPQEASAGSSLGERNPPPHIDPKRNRVPGSTNIDATKLICSQCGSVEYNADAKFCRDCGNNLKPKIMLISCGSCGEKISGTSRFCPSCGNAVHSVAKGEEAVALPKAVSLHAKTCPACNTFCKRDEKFCDNCGSSFSEVESKASSAAVVKVEFMHCATCNEDCNDLSAIFCEECGSKLEKKEQISHMGSGVTTPKGESTPSERKKMIAPEKFPSRSPGGVAPVREITYPEEADEFIPVERSECKHCGRSFATEALQRHQEACRKTKRRPVFNMAKQRLQGTDIPTVKSTSQPPPAPPKHDWKKESEDFRKALREARKVEQILKAGGDLKNLPPPTYSENPNYRQCPHCQRRFAPDVAERHIPKCATTVNRPKAPPRRRF